MDGKKGKQVDLVRWGAGAAHGQATYGAQAGKENKPSTKETGAAQGHGGKRWATGGGRGRTGAAQGHEGKRWATGGGEGQEEGQARLRGRRQMRHKVMGRMKGGEGTAPPQWASACGGGGEKGQAAHAMDGKKETRVDLVRWGQAQLRGKPPMEHKQGRKTSLASRRQAQLKVMEGRGGQLGGEGAGGRGGMAQRHFAKLGKKTGIGPETGPEDIVTENI